MLNNREILILQFLINVKKTNIYTLVNKYSVSESTIRYNIKNINSVFDILKIPKIKIKNNEIELNFNDETIIKNFLKEEMNFSFSKDERKLVYIFKLLFSNSFNITHIADLLYISRMTVKNDLYELEREGRIKYIDNIYKVSENNEISDKTNILYSIMKNNKLKKLVINEIDRNKWDKIYKFIDLTKEILEINFNFTDMLYVQCLIFVIVFHYYENSIQNKVLDIPNLDRIFELENSYKKLFKNNKNFNLIIDILVGLSLNYSLDNWVNESIFVKKLIYSISKDIYIDLTKDMTLFEFLCFHIKSCIYRLRKNIFLESSNYIDLVEKNEIYYSVKSNLKEIENIYQIQFNEEEIALITFHISSSIERQNKDRKTVVLVCGLGYGTSKILSKKLNEIFNIDIVNIISIYELKTNYEKYKDVDYIISTINIDFVNSINITPLLNNNDQEKLIKYGLKINRKKIELNKFFEDIEVNNFKNLQEIIMEKYPDYFYIDKQNYIKSLFKHFSDSKIIFSNENLNYKQAIYKACEPLIIEKSVTSEYYDEILKLISDYGPYMFLGNKIAIVHAGTKNVNKNDMSILISKQKISIENKSANIIICFATLNDYYHKILLNSVLNILDNDEIIEKIISKNNIDELKNITK